MRTVSVVLCTYNGEKYLRQQLDSILSQTYPIEEIIIQDDNSTDGTPEIIMEYVQRYSIVQYFKNTAEPGVNGNFFSAIKLATADYIALSDQDDIWHPDKLEKQIQAIGNHMLCSHRDNYISEDGCFIHNDERQRNVYLLRLLFSNIPGHSFLFSKSLLGVMPKCAKVYTEKCYDVAFSVAAATCESLVYINESLIDFRRHPNALTYHDYSDTLPTVKNALHIFTTCLGHYSSARKKANVYFRIMLDYIESLSIETDAKKEVTEILKLELLRGIIPFIKLQYYFIKNAHRLFQTPGRSMVKIIRAFLYPIMQYYNYTK